MSDSKNVTVAKPGVGGAIYKAPVGSKLPTNAIDTLDPAFVSLGYVSEDGLTNSNTLSTEDIKEWGGSVVYSAETEKSDKLKFKLIEALNTDVLKTVYGDSNVTGDLTNGITIKANSVPQKEYAWVVDTILKDGILKRIVVPNGKVTEVGDVVYKNNELVGYETTLTAFPDETGNTHYEYISKPANDGEQR